MTDFFHQRTKDLTMAWNSFNRFVVEPIEDLAYHFKQLVSSLPEDELVVLSHHQAELALGCITALVCGLLKQQTDLPIFLATHQQLRRVRVGQVLGADILPGIPDGNSRTEEVRAASNRLQGKFNHYSSYLFWIDDALSEINGRSDRALTVENLRAAFLRTIDLHRAMFRSYEHHSLGADFGLLCP